ncbi:cellulose-binding domain-containing protein [Actinoplanes sp. CA-051413]|uniref:cellulose-binding domain-containing protein n=1 Tax=Actinoplanes sp. CA-051413 TaxID=3239899 RepID=UPI003D969899
MALRRTRRLLAAVLAVGLGATLSVMTMTAHAAAAGCQVSYTVGSQWQGGFGASVAVTNLGDPINGWTLRWSFGAGQTVGQAWNATVTQSGATVTAAGVSYNAALATGASASFGFNGTWTGSNPVPTGFTLNNVACTGSTTTTPPTTPPTTRPTTTPTAAPTTAPPNGTPPARTVRVYWLRPTDKAFDQRYPDGITSVMKEAQRFFKAQLGKTFTLNTPVVEVVNGLHDTNWYITNNCTGSDHYWCVVENGQRELQQRFGADSRWINVEEVSAEETNKSGGGGGNGWVLLSGHDADGAAGVNGPINRWYGGMVHELGHAFGLPDATSTDGTCMSASLYDYPNCTFSQTQKNGILNGPFASFLS